MGLRPWLLVAAAALLLGVGSERVAVRPRARPDAAGAAGRPKARRGFALALLIAAGGARGQDAEGDALVDHEALHALLTTEDGGTLPRDKYMSAVQSMIAESGMEASAAASASSFYERLFDRADIDGDAALNAMELEYESLLHQLTARERGHEEWRNDLGAGEIKTLFDEADESGDGVVDKEEWLKAMRKTAADNWVWGSFLDEPVVTEYFDKLFQKGDVTGDGVMNEKEVQFTALRSWKDVEEGLFIDQIFADLLLKTFDTDNDGTLDVNEVSKASVDRRVAKIQGKKFRRPGYRVKEHFAEADANADERLDRSELLKITGQWVSE